MPGRPRRAVGDDPALLEGADIGRREAELGQDLGVVLADLRRGAVDAAAAMRQALEAGRLSYQAGRIPKKRYATASSPFDGVISYIPGE